jgi:hypothetical protein
LIGWIIRKGKLKLQALILLVHWFWNRLSDRNIAVKKRLTPNPRSQRWKGQLTRTATLNLRKTLNLGGQIGSFLPGYRVALVRAKEDDRQTGYRVALVQSTHRSGYRVALVRKRKEEKDYLTPLKSPMIKRWLFAAHLEPFK